MKKILRHAHRRIALFTRGFGFSRSFFVFAGIAFLVLFLLLLGRDFLMSRVYRAIRDEIPKQTARVVPSLVEEIDEEQLLSSSFTDLFSGTGWIDTQATTMYHDRVASAFMWTPNISIGGDTTKKSPTLSAKTDYCVQGKCLSLRDGAVVYEGISLALPRELERENRTLSLGVINNKWVLGGVVKNTGIYEGYAFFWDGKSFSPICQNAKLFDSKYSGIIAFGGVEDDFLIFFGGYEGKAFRVYHGACEDISRFFGLRIMNEGFSPHIVRSESGDWYIGRTDASKALLVKLVNDGSGGIGGIVDLSGFISEPNASLSILGAHREQSGETTVDAVLESPNVAPLGWRMSDKGFVPVSDGVVASLNLNTYPNSKVRRARIVDADFKEGSTDITFLLSNDGEEWVEARVGDEVKFPNRGGDKLFWRAEFRRDGGGNISPYFKRIRVDFKVKLL